LKETECGIISPTTSEVLMDNKILHEALVRDYGTKEEIRSLIAQYKSEKNPEKALLIRDEIFSNSVRQIKKISLKFSKMYEDPEDCFQNGVLGFFDALENFDLSKKTAFSTYLFYWVYKYIFEGCQKTIVSIPRNVQFMNYTYLKYKEILESEDENNNKTFLSNKIFKSDVFKKKYMDKENVNAEVRVFSLEQEVDPHNPGKALRFVNLIRDVNKTPEDVVVENVNREQLIEIINTKLSERERDIILLRYFSDTENLLTLKEIVKVVGTTSERVRQIEERALMKLKRVFIRLKREECF
jgi:RNA polymerase sigma factor (sigma-70 family)